MKYLKYMVIGTLLVSGMFAKELPENQAWNNFRFAPKLAGDAPAYSLINIGNFGHYFLYINLKKNRASYLKPALFNIVNIYYLSS